MNDAPIRILFVDNQVEAREWLAEWLRRVHKFQVDTAGDGTESVRLVQKARGSYDVILMDLLLDRGTDGIETMKAIRGLDPRVETIIITGFGGVEDGVKAMQAGAYRYVLKPLNKEELVVYIRHAAERRRLLSEASRSKVYETFSALRMGPDPNAIMHRFVENLSGQFNLTTCTIALLDPDKTHLDVVAESGLGRRVVKYLKDLPKDMEKVLVEHEPLSIPNLDDRLDWKRALTRPDLKSFTLLPLCGKEGAPLGVITMGRTESSEWTEEDLRLFKNLADRVAADIENALLDEERQNWERFWEAVERAQLLETLDRASLDIADPSEAKDVLLKTIQGATEMLQASGGGVYLFKSTSEGEHLAVEKSYGVPYIAEGTIVDGSRGVVGQVLGTRKPFSKTNYSDWDARQEQFDHFNLSAVIGVPITNGERLLGVLAIHDTREGREFSRAQENILLRFGKHAGAALEKARLLDEQMHTDRLIQGLVSGLEDEGLHDKVLKLLRDHFEYDYCALLLKDADELYIASAINFPLDVQRNTRIGVGEGKGVTACAARLGRTVVVPDVRKDGRYIPGIVGGRAEIAVPLKVGDRVIGVLDVESTRVNAFTAHDERLLERVAAAIAVQIDHAQSIEEAKRLMEQSAFMDEFTSDLLAADGLEAKLRVVSGNLLKVIPADFCLVMLLTRDGLSLRVRDAHAGPDPAFRWSPKLGKLCSVLATPSMSEAVLGAKHKVFRRGEMVGEPLLENLVRRLSLERPLESALLIPLREGARFTGLCILGDLCGCGRETFSEQKIGRAVTLAEKAASPVQQARMFELEHELNKKLEHLNIVGRAMTATLKPDMVLNLIDGYSRELLNAEVSTTFLVRRPGFLSLASNSGSPDGTAVIGLELEIKDGDKAGLTGHIAKVGEVFNKHGEELANHLTVRSRGPHAHLPSKYCKSLLAVPLKQRVDGREEVIGLIKVENKMDIDGRLNTTSGFHEEDVQILKMLGSFAVNALQNADHFAFADALQRVAQVVNSSITDYQEVLQRVLLELRPIVPFDTASIQLRAGDTLKVRACDWFSEEEKGKVLQLSFPLIPRFPNYRVMTEKRERLIPDVRATEYEHFWREANIYCSGHIRAWLGVPLLYKGEAVGMLSIESNTPARYTQTHVERAVAFASQVVSAIVNAESYKSAESLLGLVEDITRHLEPKTVLQNIAADAINKEAIIGADIAIIYEYDKDRALFHEDPVYAGGPLERPELINPPHNHQSIIYRCIDLREPHLADDATRDPILSSHFTTREDIKSAAVFPLMVGGPPVGLMFINYRTPHHFTEQEERVMSLFAKYAAIAIQNARQHEMIRRRMETATAMARVGRLASIWAHDVRTPAFTTRLLVDVLRSRLKDPQELDILERIYAAANDIGAIIPKLPDRHEPERVDLAEVLREVEEKRRSELARARVSLEVEPDNLRPVEGNSRWMVWILNGLIGNALRSMKDGGTISVRGQVRASRLSLDVIDTGDGPSESVRNQLFVGRVIDPGSDGRGWGLLLIKDVLNDYDGDISLPHKNEQGRNVFTLDLPLAAHRETQRR